MEIRIAQIIVWDGRAFVPSKGRYRNGIFASVEPVHVVGPAQAELVPVVRTILSAEPILLPDPTSEEVKVQQELLPRVTGARSWKRLCQKGISYVIEVSATGVRLEISRLDEKGRWEFDPNKRTQFPPSSDIAVVIQAVLNDLATRPK
jgi:hypothetical protein